MLLPRASPSNPESSPANVMFISLRPLSVAIFSKGIRVEPKYRVAREPPLAEGEKRGGFAVELSSSPPQRPSREPTRPRHPAAGQRPAPTLSSLRSHAFFKLTQYILQPLRLAIRDLHSRLACRSRRHVRHARRELISRRPQCRTARQKRVCSARKSPCSQTAFAASREKT